MAYPKDRRFLFIIHGATPLTSMQKFLGKDTLQQFQSIIFGRAAENGMPLTWDDRIVR